MNYVKHLNLFGVDAKPIPCDVGEGAPSTSTVGAVGCFYMDTLTSDIYKCISAADDMYIWELFGNCPATVAEDGYTDIAGLRKPINMMFVKSDSSITVTTTLQGDRTSTSVVTIGENGRPSTIVTDGVECSIGWEGF